jgi:hydrogenase nickel incorporation protein HypA/HybF
MHELSVCLSLLAQLERIAADHGADAVQAIHLRLGPLSGVEPELLRSAWPLAATGTVAQAAQLDIESGDILVHCTNCERESTASVNRLLCSHCGDFRTRVVRGDELLLVRVELNTPLAALPV